LRFGEILAEVYASRRGCGQPQFAFFIRSSGFESIEKTEAAGSGAA